MTQNSKNNCSFHLGIYAIVLKDRSILLIKKSRGPYIGMLDLPGGRPEWGEPPLETVIREVKEETGVMVTKATPFDNYSTVATSFIESQQHQVYHLGMIYYVDSYDDLVLQKEVDIEDSLVADWYPIDLLTTHGLSPLALQSIADLTKRSFV